MTYIHGGGFEIGIQELIFGPSYFMDHNVVLVLFNYRLGSLGNCSYPNNKFTPLNNIVSNISGVFRISKYGRRCNTWKFWIKRSDYGTEMGAEEH